MEPVSLTRSAKSLHADPQPIFERNHAGETRRDVLARAVPEDDIRHDPPRTPELGQGDLERKQGRLRVVDAVEHVRRLARRIEDVLERRADEGSENLVAALQRRAKDGFLRVEFPTHADVLTALTREQERELPGAGTFQGGVGG
jgi:hypothetical protein